MLLAATITFIMVIFLHTIFSTITNTVSLGMATSDILRANADATARLSADADPMVGSLAGGFMVILQKQIDGVRLRADDPPVSTVRSDQVIWIRTLTGDHPPTPATPAAPGSYSHATTTATHARVWYGHVLRTDSSGTAAGELGEPGHNAIASQWILGRQLLFLDGAPSAAVHIDSTAAYPNWPVNGYGGYAEAPADRWYKGLSDIVNADLDGIRNYFDGLAGLGGVGYPAGPYQFTYGAQRLWCNPQPPEGPDLPSWRVAQMHPYFIGNVSDLRIDFAGDHDGILGIDLSLIEGQIKWYSHFYNNPSEGRWGGQPYDANEPVTYKPPTYAPPLMLGGFVTIDLFPRSIYEANPPGLPHADAAFTFSYRVHDPRGQLADRDGRPGKLFERVVRIPSP
jgi:hypothetical protein